MACLLHELDCKAAATREITLRVAADNLYDPLAGNKGCKLKPWLERVGREGFKGVVGEGGAWSNFILSLAIACRDADIKCVGLIRGDDPSSLSPPQPLNPMLQDAANAGMELRFVSRQYYRERRTASWADGWQASYPGYLLIPEGGSNLEAAKACRALLPSHQQTSHWVIAAGTGATAAGLAAAMPGKTCLMVYSVTGDRAVESTVRDWASALNEASSYPSRDIHQRIVFKHANPPAYAKLDKRICDAVNACYEQCGLLLDPLYTAKAFFRTLDAIADEDIPAGSEVTLIHTGGLQGWRGCIAKYSHWLSDAVNKEISGMHLQL